LCVAAVFTLTACSEQPTDRDAASAPSREPLRHRASIADPRPLESVTGTLLFDNGCWVVTSGPNRIAIFFPKETRLASGKDLIVGKHRLREGETYKFVGDLSETATEGSPTCNNLPASIAAGDVWPPQPER
jgi:hypothetical protein